MDGKPMAKILLVTKKCIVLALSLFLMYCGGAGVYVPHTVPTPDFEKKEQLQISLNKSRLGYDPFIGYSFFNDIAGFGSLSFANGDSAQHRHIFAEAGLVYFLVFDDFFGSQKFNTTQINIITAFGTGSASGDFDQLASGMDILSAYGTGYYNRWYLQLNLSRKSERSIRNQGLINKRTTLSNTYGLATRISNVAFYEIYNDELTIKDSISQSFWENTLFIKVSFDRFIFELQIGTIKPLGKTDIIEYEPLHSSIGIGYMISN
jgi:hypothetical protein